MMGLSVNLEPQSTFTVHRNKFHLPIRLVQVKRSGRPTLTYSAFLGDLFIECYFTTFVRKCINSR